MLKKLFQKVSAQRSSTQELITRELIIPGTLVIGLVCLLRLSSLLQIQEWMAFDTFSRYCLTQEHPTRITLVTVDEQDYQTTGFPISADILATALTTIQTYEPKVIGLDIFRDLPQGESQAMLRKVLATTPNVIAAEVALSGEPMMHVQAPEGTPTRQVGFADSVVDGDGKLRRIVLSAKNERGLQKDSFALLLAKQYLAAEGIDLDKAVKLPKFQSNSGGYIRTNAGVENSNTQMLLNFCMLQQPYETVSLRDILAENIDASKLTDRVVLIGKTATQAKDSFITSAVSQTLYSQQVFEAPYPTKIIYGVEIHAYTAEQIIGTALGMKCTIETWTEAREYLWIMLWGLLGMTASVLLRSPWKSIIALTATALLLTLLSYYLLTQNIWAPVVPSVLALCSAGLITAFFDREMRFELAQQQATIERTYEAMHSGPLQRLADISRRVKTNPPSSEPSSPNEQLQQQLTVLNNEMRNIFVQMRQDTVSQRYSLYLDETTLLDLQAPLSDLLYQVYEHSLQQPLPGFENIQTYITPIFETFGTVPRRKRSSIATKRGLCLFLQAALLNVGNHAIGATRLDVVCLAEDDTYRLQIIDNGAGLEARRGSRQGTYQARAIARQLGGTFNRRASDFSEGSLNSRSTNSRSTNENEAKLRQPQGTLCELTWPR